MGDTNMDTDNPIILKQTLNFPTIMCMQRKAQKKIPTEADIIQANKIAFNDDIGIVTNHVTSMFDVQAGFEKGTKEYDTLAYRIMCGQDYQQASIDRVKGIIAKSMPEYWYSVLDNKRRNEDPDIPDEEKELNERIIAPHKPYFMTYVYSGLKQKYTQWQKVCDADAQKKFRMKLSELLEKEDKTKEEEDFIYYYRKGIEVGDSPCVVNRICHIFENEFPNYSGIMELKGEFDYELLKCNVGYSAKDYNAIAELYKTYKMEFDAFRQNMRINGYNSDDERYERETFIEKFRMESRKICTNEQELCDIILDLCYKKEYTKQFAWDVVGDVIVSHLLQENNYEMTFPKCGGKTFEFGGEMFDMVTVCIPEGVSK